ncbi:ABC transporter ATP-binding protein [Rhodonellum sp.]|uniref:ABC transporter ATP-binding protein n=1 Tax=Rhodonellum sp. TaxID=2231180 RepID=UPI00272396A8|nr:ABC transporter ATP-binding protein [Rhodonellum sp.]MDO9553103.1 ABC transporter ATP-binding protein [Rhodonellum sp.]
MSKSVIKVQDLSKRYRIGLKEKQSETLIGQIVDILKSPFSNLKKLKEMNRFGLEDESVFWALRDINFEVKEGEVLGIIGKNGAGKSTLLKILSQITEPTTGRIEIHGRVASLLEVGTGFHPELSGRENIYMNGTILGMTKREIDFKLDEIIDFSGVEKFIDTPVKFYSSGMKVRLGFSVAAHLEPEILIIDEVLAVGDFEFQKKCLGKMEDVAGQGRTVLFVSHNLGAISSLCNTGFVLNGGSGFFFNSIDDAIQDYFKISNKKSSSMLDVLFSGPLSDSFVFEELLLNNRNPFFEDIIILKNDNFKLIIKGKSNYNNKIRVVISLFKDEVKLFSLFDSNSFDSVGELFSSIFIFDLSLLREGRYSVAIGVHSKNDDWLWNESVFTFEIVDDADLILDRRNLGLFDISTTANCFRI